MKTIVGNVWDFYGQGKWVVIPTNGSVRSDGCAVMGKGVALQAAQRLPALPRFLGSILSEPDSNHVHMLEDFRVVIFPTKGHWKNGSETKLIERSAREMERLVRTTPSIAPVYMPKPGCGEGGLDWPQVEPLLKCLEELVVIVEYHSDWKGPLTKVGKP